MGTREELILGLRKLTISQHWFRLWLGAISQQSWTNVDQHLVTKAAISHMISLLSLVRQWFVICSVPSYCIILWRLAVHKTKLGDIWLKRFFHAIKSNAFRNIACREWPWLFTLNMCRPNYCTLNLAQHHGCHVLAPYVTRGPFY